jgi:hypothetical protein
MPEVYVVPAVSGLDKTCCRVGKPSGDVKPFEVRCKLGYLTGHDVIF